MIPESLTIARARWQRLRSSRFHSLDMQHLIQVDLPRLWQLFADQQARLEAVESALAFHRALATAAMPGSVSDRRRTTRVAAPPAAASTGGR
jgi:hypothetical protein